MPDLNPIAKRIHNIQPRPVRLAIDGDDAGVFEFSSTEFFQREFRGEGSAPTPTATPSSGSSPRTTTSPCYSGGRAPTRRGGRSSAR